MKKYVLTRKNESKLEQPLYFNEFDSMIDAVQSTIREALIQNEASYLAVIRFDETLEFSNEWHDQFDSETYLIIDHERQTLKAKTSHHYWNLEFFGELIPERGEDH